MVVGFKDPGSADSSNRENSTSGCDGFSTALAMSLTPLNITNRPGRLRHDYEGEEGMLMMQETLTSYKRDLRSV